jgi:hypothetical protein
LTVALVLGGGAGVWADVEAALDLSEVDGVVACNDVAASWPGRLDAMVSLHAEKLHFWMARRARSGHPPPDRVFTKEASGNAKVAVEQIHYRFPGQDRTGSSGLFALKVALIDLGFDKAVVCGVPMTEEGRHFFDATAWRGALSHRAGWTQALPQIAERARSMSGWTRELLGAPDAAWLDV